MKNHNEMYRSLLSRYNEYQEKKNRQKRMIKRTVPVLACFCFTAVLGIGYWGHTEKISRIPEQSEVIEEPVTENPVSITEADILTTVHSDKQTKPVTTAKSVKGSETGRSTLTITTVTADTTLSVKSSETEYSASTGTKITQTDTETESGIKTETTLKASPQTQTEPITTNQTETTSIYQVTTSVTQSEEISKTGTTTTVLYTYTTTDGGQTTTTAIVIKKPDEIIILAIENTDFSRSVSEFQNGEKYKYTGNYMKLTDISDFEYIDSFKVYYYFGPIKDEMSSVYKVYTVPNEEDKAAVQIDNSDFFLFFEKCIQE